ncbi:MAG: cupin domain-containing protein [Planctomycetaceae bacterium]|nr:cupin domain-containing protein [Planctomycetaceae bacterium]
MENLLANLPHAVPRELTNILVQSAHARIERIVSTGHSSPAGFWYDQSEAEWVLVLTGEALLRFEDEESPRRLSAGDFVLIPPHRRHRVEWTLPGQPTVWLAVFISGESSA